jgi:hypothetical protein
MGKYFKEDNQRISKASQGVDVSFLAKRLILAQLQVMRPRPAQIKGFGNQNYTITPGKRPLNYARPPGGVGAVLDFAANMFPKLRLVKSFVEFFTSGGFDKKLSERFNNDLITETLNKQYLVPVGSKSRPEPVQLRQLLSEYNPETKLLQKPYNFTNAQLQEMARDIEALDAEAVKWRNWKVGIPSGVGAAGALGYGIKAKSEHKLDPHTPKIEMDVEAIMAKQPKKATNPRQGQQ